MAYFSKLSEDEQLVVRRSLELIFEYFDLDFHKRVGVSKAEMQQVIDAWPEIDDLDDDSVASIAINNTLNELLHGVSIADDECRDKIGVDYVDLLRIYKKWASLRGWDRTGVR